MTRYLSAIGLENAPFLELYENYGRTPPPIELGFEPPIAGPIDRLRFSQDLTKMVLVNRFRREDIEGLGHPEFEYAGDRIFAPDSSFLLLTGDSTVPPKMLRRKSQFYVDEGTFPVISGQYITMAAMSNKADVLLTIWSGTPGIVDVYDKVTSGGTATWVKKTEIEASPSWIGVSENSQYLLIGVEQIIYTEQELIDDPDLENSYVLYRLLSGSYEPVFVSHPSTGRLFLKNARLKSDGSLCLAFMVHNGDSVLTSITMSVRNVAGTFSHSAEFETTLYPPQFDDFSVNRFLTDGDVFVFMPLLVITGSNNLRVYCIQVDQTYSLQQTAQTWAAYNSRNSFDIYEDCSRLVCQHQPISGPNIIGVFINTGTEKVPNFIMATSRTFTTTRLLLSPDKVSFFAKTSSGGNVHYQINSPYDQLTYLPGFGTTPASDIEPLIYAPDGMVMMGEVSGEEWAGIRDGGGNFLDYSTLEGTFVNLYDREPSGGHGVFIEREFVQHIAGTIITDIVISKLNSLLLYHADHPTNESPGGKGRFVYRIANKAAGQFDLIDYIYEAGDTRSLAAVNDSESHFVVVRESDAQASDVRLYRIEGEFEYVETDDKPVEYGPPAFSNCDVVLVAHGGMQPYSLFDHVVGGGDDILVPIPINVSNWDETALVIDIIMTQDCTKVVVVTEDEVIVYEDEEEQDRADYDAPDDGRPATHDPDNGQVNVPGGNNGGGGGGYYVDNDGNLGDLIEYAPYVCVSVTIRNRFEGAPQWQVS